MKLYIRAPLMENDLKRLEHNFEEIVYEPWTITGERYYEEKLIEKLNTIKPDAIITELDEVSAKVLENYDRLRFIGDCRATPENIDVNACTEHSLPLLCTPGRNAQAVAELWISTLIAFKRNLISSIEWLNSGEWVKGTTPYYLFRGTELFGKKVGFVGMGNVPRTISNLIKAFNCQLTFYDPFVEEDIDGVKKVSLEEIFKESDIVSIHLPANNSTKEMIDKTYLNLMKKDAIFINSSRAEVIKTEDLFNALKSNKILGAIIDVFEHEPLEEGKTIFQDLSNVMLTPHIFGASREVVVHQSRIIVDRIEKFLNKEDLSKIIYNKSILE